VSQQGHQTEEKDMPIYEFYCPSCHTVFNFLSKTMNTTRCPTCPDCGRPKLERQISRFAISKGQAENGTQYEEAMEPDDVRIARELGELSAEHATMDLDDPLHVVPMIRRTYEIAGKPIPDRAQELIRQLEAGGDPESIDEEFGDLWDDEDSPFAEGAPLHQHVDKFLPPHVDEAIHDL
jgi:putative FmdB family regulatory protein